MPSAGTLSPGLWLPGNRQGNHPGSRDPASCEFALRSHLIWVRPSGRRWGLPHRDAACGSKGHKDGSRKDLRLSRNLVASYDIYYLILLSTTPAYHRVRVAGSWPSSPGFTNTPAPAMRHPISLRGPCREGRASRPLEPVATSWWWYSDLTQTECVWLDFKQTRRFVAPTVPKTSKNKLG